MGSTEPVFRFTTTKNYFTGDFSGVFNAVGYCELYLVLPARWSDACRRFEIENCFHAESSLSFMAGARNYQMLLTQAGRGLLVSENIVSRPLLRTLQILGIPFRVVGNVRHEVEVIPPPRYHHAPAHVFTGASVSRHRLTKRLVRILPELVAHWQTTSFFRYNQ